MSTLSGLQMNTSTDSLASKLLSNFFELYSKCYELHDCDLHACVSALHKTRKSQRQVDEEAALSQGHRAMTYSIIHSPSLRTHRTSLGYRDTSHFISFIYRQTNNVSIIRKRDQKSCILFTRTDPVMTVMTGRSFDLRRTIQNELPSSPSETNSHQPRSTVRVADVPKDNVDNAASRHCQTGDFARKFYNCTREGVCPPLSFTVTNSTGIFEQFYAY